MESEIKREIEIVLTPYECARMFASFHSDEHAQFFNHLVELVEDHYAGGDFGMQLAYICDDDDISKDALQLMEQIGEHAAQKSKSLNLNQNQYEN